MYEESIPLIVGICSCTELYHASMAGHEIIVPELTGYRYFGWHYLVPLEKSLIFRIQQEVRISERHEREYLEKTGCNFFVDVHPGSGPGLQTVSLVAIHPIPENPADPGRTYVSGEPTGIAWYSWMQKIWPPTVEEVKDGMVELIRRMDEQGLHQWLNLVAEKWKRWRHEE